MRDATASGTGDTDRLAFDLAVRWRLTWAQPGFVDENPMPPHMTKPPQSAGNSSGLRNISRCVVTPRLSLPQQRNPHCQPRVSGRNAVIVPGPVVRQSCWEVRCLWIATDSRTPVSRAKQGFEGSLA